MISLVTLLLEAGLYEISFKFLRLHRNTEVNHTDNLEDREDNEGGSSTQTTSDDREEESNSNIQHPHEDVCNRGTLINQLRREILRGHDEEERTGTAFKTENEQQHTNNSNNRQTLQQETSGDGDGTKKHNAQSQ